MMGTQRIDINRRQYLELEKLGLGALDPLTGFMTEAEFTSVVDRMRLPDGQVFPLPVLLDLPLPLGESVAPGARIPLLFEGVEVGQVEVQSAFTCDKRAVAEQVFGTADEAHPGVAHFLKMGEVFVGGPTHLIRRVGLEFSADELTPEQTRRIFRERGWSTVVGFQTRNVPHRAHEYLLRLGLELADGLFIQPLVGRKKRGDYTPEAILTAYRTLIRGFLPEHRVVLGVLSTAMRYAGPREALFHAIIRRNYGCTHFIVGRDHAGVGNYYDKYAAHELTRRFEDDLGIRILRCAGPYFCPVCGGIATERSCPHGNGNGAAAQPINGTDVRRWLQNGDVCPPELVRPEVIQSLRGVPLFIEEEDE